jgi:hypothetical protein
MARKCLILLKKRSMILVDLYRDQRQPGGGQHFQRLGGRVPDTCIATVFLSLSTNMPAIGDLFDMFKFGDRDDDDREHDHGEK